MTLEALFARAGVNNWNAATWFPRAVLKPPYLFIDADVLTLAFVERNYLPALREQIPGLELRPALQEARPTVKPKPFTRYPALKPGPWRDALDRDLLD